MTKLTTSRIHNRIATGIAILKSLILLLLLLLIIAFKGAIQDFLQSPHSAANCFQHVRSSGPGATVCKSRATHRALITCKHVVLRATWDEGTAQLLSLTEVKSHLFELYFIGWTTKRWRRGENRSTRRKPMTTSFRKCHILKPRDSSPKWDSNSHNSNGGWLGKQTC